MSDAKETGLDVLLRALKLPSFTASHAETAEIRGGFAGRARRRSERPEVQGSAGKGRWTFTTAFTSFSLPPRRT